MDHRTHTIIITSHQEDTPVLHIWISQCNHLWYSFNLHHLHSLACHHTHFSTHICMVISIFHSHVFRAHLDLRHLRDLRLLFQVQYLLDRQPLLLTASFIHIRIRTLLHVMHHHREKVNNRKRRVKIPHFQMNNREITQIQEYPPRTFLLLRHHLLGSHRIQTQARKSPQEMMTELPIHDQRMMLPMLTVFIQLQDRHYHFLPLYHPQELFYQFSTHHHLS